jgi:hypothetical protein
MAHVIEQDAGMAVFLVRDPMRLAKIFLTRKLRGTV